MLFARKTLNLVDDLRKTKILRVLESKSQLFEQEVMKTVTTLDCSVVNSDKKFVDSCYNGFKRMLHKFILMSC